MLTTYCTRDKCVTKEITHMKKEKRDFRKEKMENGQRASQDEECGSSH